ncbi:hypothetical protein Mapa_018280 [Marchantia paleacea]|nr:hypothetical protein Mapa_018280 [Marchantia paleacea]
MTFITLEHILAHTSFFLLFFVTFIYWGKFLYINIKTITILGEISMKIACFCITSFLLIRWVSSGHFPLSNLYESSMFLSWNFTLIHLILENKSKNTWLSIITAPSAMLAHGFATLSLPKEMQESLFLVPALQSHWLMMHVTMMMLIWANEAWGSYWNWDPKETWALITWLIFAIYLHTRMIKGWQGKKPAIIASLGFFIVWICYLGVNLLGKGLHSYGWLV